MENIVVFDFDGTLSKKDSSLEFGRYCFFHSIRPWFFIPAIAFAFIVRIFLPNGFVWRELVRSYLTNDMIKKLRDGFIKEHLQERFGWAKEQVIKEKNKGNTVILISAGPDFLIPYLVADIPFDNVLCSVMDKKYPWKFDFLAYGKGKVKILNNNYKNFRLIRSYADSKSDRYLMNLADDKVWINSHTGLRK